VMIAQYEFKQFQGIFGIIDNCNPSHTRNHCTLKV